MQKDLEKIIIFETTKNNLIFELFSHNNIILTDKKNNILGCLYKEIWDKREIKPGKKYLFPQSEKESPLKVAGNYLDLKELMGKTNVPPSLVEHIYKEEKSLEEVAQKLKKLYKEEILRNSCFLIKTKKLEYFPINLEDTEKINKSLNDVLDDYFFGYVDKTEETKDSKKVRELTTTLKKMDEKIEEFQENVSKYNDAAKWIEENYNQIEEVKAAIEKGLSLGKNPRDILELLKGFKDKYPIIGQISSIDLKNKKIIFSIPQNQQ
jgi:predicted ribosome quality control (RQC) complex YloA/Tae2 family protein